MVKEEMKEEAVEQPAEEPKEESKITQLRSLHLLERMKYRELLQMCKDEGIETKGKKGDVIRIIATELTPEKIREHFTKFRGTEVLIGEHKFVPLHEIMAEKEAKALIDKLHCSRNDLPKIKDTDPMVLKLGAKPGDIIRVTRDSQTAGEAYYYRLVVRNV